MGRVLEEETKRNQEKLDISAKKLDSIERAVSKVKRLDRALEKIQSKLP